MFVFCRTAFVAAELERHGGVSPHVSPMMQVSDGAALLSATGFAIPTGIAQCRAVHLLCERVSRCVPVARHCCLRWRVQLTRTSLKWSTVMRLS